MASTLLMYTNYPFLRFWKVGFLKTKPISLRQLSRFSPTDKTDMEQKSNLIIMKHLFWIRK